MALTHGELFAGIGGFSVGFERAGIETRWAVEIDPQARAVLRARWPDIALYGDVREVGAHNLEAVDVITFGSPCQDLSVAGKREGLAGERSGLYFEAIRIISELRPTVAVWENVAGAFSSRGGADYHSALQALADVGALDIGWAVLDAQWFGVPQRRRRIFTVADFRGRRAGEILALDYGLQGHPAPRREAGEGAPGYVTASAGRSRGAGTVDGVALVPDVAGTLGGPTTGGERQDLDSMAYIPSYWDGGQVSDTLDVSGLVKGQMMPEKRRFPVVLSAPVAHTVRPSAARTLRDGGDNLVAHTLRGEGFDASEDGTGRGTPLVVVDASEPLGFQWRAGGNTGLAMVEDGMGALHSDQAPAVAIRTANTGANGHGVAEDVSHTLDGAQGQAVAFAVRGRAGGAQAEPSGDLAPALRTPGGGSSHAAVAVSQNQRGEVRTADVAPALGLGGGKPGVGYPAAAVEAGGALMVRRLTPLECCRLQGFPDDWLDGLNLSDSAKYRMLGNAVAVPVVEWLGRSIVTALEGGGVDG